MRQGHALYIITYTARATYQNIHTLSKGPSCFCFLEVPVLPGYTFRGRTEGAHEENEDVRDDGSAKRWQLRHFVFLSETVRSHRPNGFVFGRMFLRRNLVSPYLICTCMYLYNVQGFNKNECLNPKGAPGGVPPVRKFFMLIWYVALVKK